MMKKIILSALAILGIGVMATEASAQMYIIKDGKVKVALDYTPDYITFENPMLCGGIIGEAVDMGLSVKWSSVNIGASSPEQGGNLYAWGETETKEYYSWETYKYGGEFIGDNKTTLEKADDAAAANWGGGWVTPSQADWEELYNSCTCEWTTENEVNGYKITGTNGNTIFLPAAGYREGSFLYREDSYGFYWSSGLSLSTHGIYAGFDSFGFGSNSGSMRYQGASVRPVCYAAGDTNGRDAVDLGLSSGNLWASYNLGASAPHEYGKYYAWGETEAKSEYSWHTYVHMQSGSGDIDFINKYQIDDHNFTAIWYKNTYVKYSSSDGITTLEATDDAATQLWGDSWRMPTYEEWEELYNNSIHTWTDNYEGTGVSGWIMTSTKNGNVIFLPVTYNSEGVYWSASIVSGLLQYAMVMPFNYITFYFGNGFERCCGYSVRPVCPSAE